MLNEEVDIKTAELTQNNLMLKDAISDLKGAQKQLIESEKMSLLGGLVSGVAHEINTPVGVGITAASSQKDELKEIQKLFDSDNMTKPYLKSFIERSDSIVDIIMTNLYRIVDLITVFKKLAVDQSLDEKIPIELKKYIDDIIDTVKPSFKHEDLRVINDVDESLTFEAYPGAIAQIVSNTVRNSDRHAFEAKAVGEVRITAEKNGKRLHLSIADNGQGMPADAMNKIFDPFYSYHKETQGTGLGMNIVYTLVNQKLLGDVSCISKEGQGTRIEIYFPIG